MKSLCRAHLPSRVRLSLREKVNPDLELEKADKRKCGLQNKTFIWAETGVNFGFYLGGG